MTTGTLDERAALRQALFDAGLLLDTGVPGLVGQGSVFIDVRERVDALISRAAAGEGAERLAFPPLMPRGRLEASGYLHSFPHLAGSVWSFDGDEAAARTMAAQADAGQAWGEHLSMTDLVMVPAGCHPVYPALAGRGPLPPGGLTLDTGPADVFRREPSDDPARLQSFHMRELVRVADPEAVDHWRLAWRDRGRDLLTGLGLEVLVEDASDPFFGRTGRLRAANQRAQGLKFELLVQVSGPVPTAVASFNAHREHFASTYALTCSDGSEVHTACLGFGLERVVLALLATHGLSPADWPAPVRGQLWP